MKDYFKCPETGMLVSFISSYQDQIDYRIAEYKNGQENEIRLKTDSKEVNRGRFINSDAGMDPDRVIIAFNNYQEENHREYLEWCKKRGYEVESKQREPLTEIEVI